MSGVKVGVVIPTRNNRPAFLKQCLEYVKRQTHPIAKTVVVDYDQKTFPNDLAERYQYGFAQVTDCDLVFLIEDDDWYRADYIARMVERWEFHGKPDIYGINDSLYYHIFSQRYWHSVHPGRASAYSTAMRPNAPLNWERLDPLWMDIGIWEQLKGVAEDLPHRISVGIKHGIGDCGGVGHFAGFYERKDPTGISADHDYEQLREWIGADIEFYLQVIRSKKA